MGFWSWAIALVILFFLIARSDLVQDFLNWLDRRRAKKEGENYG